MTNSPSCTICRSNDGHVFPVAERMFGTRDEFTYFECQECGCLSLQDPPADTSRYYPADSYYSLTAAVKVRRPNSTLRRALKHFRDRIICFGNSVFSGWVTTTFPNQDAVECRNWLQHTSIKSPQTRILDIGCGGGWHLCRMRELGFTNLTGIDPYLANDSEVAGVQIIAAPVASLAGQKYDFIMLHHSLEHLHSQNDVLHQIRNLLADGGECLVRIPIVSRGPWRTYGTDWAEIDAPRHTVLHSELSIRDLAKSAGLVLNTIQYESEPFTYIASELYRRDLSLVDPTTNAYRDASSVFTAEELKNFEILSRRHHLPGWAGRAAFYFRTAEPASSDVTKCTIETHE